MPHIAVQVNMLIDIDVEPVSDYRRAKFEVRSFNRFGAINI